MSDIENDIRHARLDEVDLAGPRELPMLNDLALAGLPTLYGFLGHVRIKDMSGVGRDAIKLQFIDNHLQATRIALFALNEHKTKWEYISDDFPSSKK